MVKYKKQQVKQPNQLQPQQSRMNPSTNVAERPAVDHCTPNPSKKLRSMDQERAEFALQEIEGIARGEKSRQVEVRRYITSLPALIRTNGLGQALAFFRMKGTQTAHEQIYLIVSAWLCADNRKGRIFTEDADVLKAITQSDVHRYMAAQNEALALLEWLKKFATALLEKEA